jgi:hypothetical protein
MFKPEYKISDFPELAEYILNNIVINVSDTLFRLCEIEFYYWTTEHPGPRIGLSDKYPEFKDVSYRYATNINLIKKQRKTFVELKKK